MSRTPEVIINKTRKFFHDALNAAGGFVLLMAGVHLAIGNNGIGQLIVAGLLFWVASSIKFRWVKRGEVGVYE